jgi:wyosine [tRNA(Phe)-imidazoG37] synthetase (radical SAM superfamily)
MTGENADQQALLQQLETLTEENDAGKFRQELVKHINNLINTDFDKLLQLLYRLDIDEIKLRAVLHNHPDRPAGEMIADLVIERQLQKIKSRREFGRRDNDIDENEKW